MKMFVSDILKNGIWTPWYVGLMDFRTALRKMNADKDSYKYRTRRVKTQEEFDKYFAMEGIFVSKQVKQVKKWADLWKVEWIS